MTDVHWLINGWADNRLGGAPLYASDYFPQFYEYALDLVRAGKAYVDDMTAEDIDAYRRLGKVSAYRDRSVDENLDLFARMKAGEFPDGARTLRAKIDMNAPNVWMRDPRRRTMSGLGRRWLTASALSAFAYNNGITTYPSTTDTALLEHTARDKPSPTAARPLVVLRPMKVLLTNYSEAKTEELNAIN